MTTIAYKDGIIAADGRITTDNVIDTDSRNKIRRREGLIFAGSGGEDAIQAVFGGWPDPVIPHDEWDALVLDEDGFWLCSSEECKLWKIRQPFNEATALGSGSPFALTAMDMGASAAGAVRQAMKRDCATGGQVTTLKVTP